MAGFFGLFNYEKEGPGIEKDAPKKKGFVTMKKVELLWQEKEDNYSVKEQNEKIFALAEFLEYIDVDKEDI